MLYRYEKPNKTGYPNRVIIPHDLLEYYQKAADKRTTEISAKHSIRYFKGDFLFNEDYFIPEQLCTVVTTDRQASALLGMPKNISFKCDIHTHPMDSTAPSGTDLETFEEESLVCTDYQLYLIISKTEISAYFYGFKGIVQCQLPVFVTSNSSNIDFDKMTLDFENKVKVKTPKAVTQGQLYNGSANPRLVNYLNKYGENPYAVDESEIDPYGLDFGDCSFPITGQYDYVSKGEKSLAEEYEIQENLLDPAAPGMGCVYTEKSRTALDNLLNWVSTNNNEKFIDVSFDINALLFNEVSKADFVKEVQPILGTHGIQFAHKLCETLP